MSKFLNISTDNTLGGNAPDDATVVSQKAIKEYVDSKTGTRGDNIANWSTNVSNCITNIPQDINLTLDSGTLTLKAGSKAYLPDGTTYTATHDINLTSEQVSGTTYYMVGLISEVSMFPRTLSNCVSGPGATTTGGYAYDTTTNVISWYNNQGTVGGTDCSFPIAIIHTTNGTIDELTQVFNGFGYIGGTIFALPGVLFVQPDGRNSDGTLKNKSISAVSHVLVNSTARASTNGYLISANGATIQKSSAQTNWYYDEENNYCVNKTNGDTNWMIYGEYTTDANDVIQYFKTKEVFQAADYYDYKNLADDVTSLETNVVHKTGNETISGQKTFHNNVVVDNGATYIIINTDGKSATISNNAIEFKPLTTSSHGGYIDFHYAGDTGDYTARLIEGASGSIQYYGTEWDAATNSTSSRVLATKGWANNASAATNIVHRDGAEMIAGNKYFYSSSSHYYVVVQDNSVDYNVSPSSNHYRGIQFMDKTTEAGFVRLCFNSGGTNAYEMGVRGQDGGYAVMYLQRSATGVSTLSIPTPVADSTTSTQADTVGARNTKLLSYAKIDMSNLDSTGNNISRWSTNVTNCITNIPQDIKIEILSGNVTLKSGSKVYIPNGSGVFTETTIASDLTNTGFSINAFIITNGTAILGSSNASSGTTEPANPVNGQIWYDTTNNIVKRYSTSSNSWVGGFSLPVGIVVSSSGVKLFNGFGYIGSTIFALPGVTYKGAFGRNSNGTLLNATGTLTQVVTTTITFKTGSGTIRFANAGISIGNRLVDVEVLPASGTNGDMVHVVSTNRNYVYSNGWTLIDGWGIGPDVEINNSYRVTSLTPKHSFRAVDYDSFANLQSELTNLDCGTM